MKAFELNKVKSENKLVIKRKTRLLLVCEASYSVPRLLENWRYTVIKWDSGWFVVVLSLWWEFGRPSCN